MIRQLMVSLVAFDLCPVKLQARTLASFECIQPRNLSELSTELVCQHRSKEESKLNTPGVIEYFSRRPAPIKPVHASVRPLIHLALLSGAISDRERTPQWAPKTNEAHLSLRYVYDKPKD